MPKPRQPNKTNVQTAYPKIAFRLHPRVVACIDQLVETGLHGNTRADFARLAILEKLRTVDLNSMYVEIPDD